MNFLLIVSSVCILIPLVNTLVYNQTGAEEALRLAGAPGVKDQLKTTGELLFGEDAFTNPPTGEPLPKPTGLKTPSLDEATHYVHFAAAAYCSGPALADWTCQECKKVDPTNDIEIVRVFTNETRGTQAYLAKNAAKKEFILVFRGTQNVPNAMDDINWALETTPWNDGTKIHTGFHYAVISLYHDILKELTELSSENPDYRIVITGHSLGGAMATLTYYHLNYNLEGKDFAVFTYGEPRAGDKAFADYINSQTIPYARVTNEADLAPHLMPYTLGFVHHVTEYWTHNGETRVCSNEVYEDPTCSNSEPKAALNTVDHNLYMGTKIELQCV